MTSAVEKDTERRSRDASASRRALLEAAGVLFHERGYAGATVRDIGDRARIDPALIARYFGSKEGLYLAVLAEEGDDEQIQPVDPHTFVADLLGHWDQRGHSPISRAMGALEVSDDVRDQVRSVIQRRLVARLALDGPDAALRAEMLLALVLGISLTRANATLPRLSRASRARLLETLRPVVDALAR
jgi:AcrR family transcriptional regulator